MAFSRAETKIQRRYEFVTITVGAIVVFMMGGVLAIGRVISTSGRKATVDVPGKGEVEVEKRKCTKVG